MTQNIKTAVLLTSGLSNARRAGDKAERRSMFSSPTEHGTINIIALTTAKLSAAAVIEATQVIEETKVAVLHELDIRSPVSSLPATGTGTDSLIFINGHGSKEIDYCGKHMLFDEVLANLVISTLHSSLNFCKTS